MIHVRSFRTAGKCHGFDISRCQDQIRILSDATQTTIVLCDGAGSSPYGGIAASVAASTLAGNLHLNFEQYLHGALPDIRMQLTRTVDTELKKMAKEMQIDPRLLATTMLAISIDNDGRFVGVHLGDGSILWNVGSSDLLKTVSAVNMISGIVTRCVNAVERRMDSPEKKAQGHLGRNAVFTAIFTFLAFAIAQFGLMTVVKKGYAYLGYAAFITLFVPFVVHAVATKGKEI